jgi:Ca2+-binding RTX toxin-like protein
MFTSWLSRRVSRRSSPRRNPFQPTVNQLEVRYLLSVLVQPLGVTAVPLSVVGPAASGPAVKPVHTGSYTHFGGDGSDTLTTSTGDNVTLFGGDGNDTLCSSGGNNVTLTGGSGNDSVCPPSGSGVTLFGGDGNDTLTINPPGNNVTLFGGSGNDTLCSSGGNNVTLTGGSGNDSVCPPSGSGVTLFGGDGNDTLCSSGGNNVTITSGSGNDTLCSPSGSGITLFGGDGNDTLTTTPPGNNVTLFGGSGNDTVCSSGSNDVTLISGSGNDTVCSSGSGQVTMFGGDGNDTLTTTPPGNNVTLFGGSGNDTVCSSGSNDVTLIGGSGNDTVCSSGGGQITLFGGDGSDTLTTSAGTNVTIFGGSGNDTLCSSGSNDVTLIGGSGNDTVCSSGGGQITMFGGDGNDTLTTDPPGNNVTLFGGDGNDTLCSSGSNDVTLIGGSGNDTVCSSGGGQITLFGGDGDDTILTTGGTQVTLFGSNGSDSTASLTRVPLTGGGLDGITQVVRLDFDTATVPGDHVYTPAERAAIQARLEGIYGDFGIVFVQDAAMASVLADGGPYSTLFFNKGEPGGAADAFDFRNLDHGDTAAIDVNGLLGQPGQPANTPDNFTALSTTIAAHELGHLLGLRHADSFGPIGAGIIPSLASAYIPAYAGPTGAVETYHHVMASPESVGSSLTDAVGSVYPGEREAIKLAFDESGVVVDEQPGPHGTFATAQALGELPALNVPNTLQPGDLHYGQTLVVGALDVVGALTLDPATGRSQNDVYSFTGHAGDLYDFDVYSGTLPRIANPIDSIVSVYDASGNLVATNDDDFESHDSSLLDVRLPADGTYYVVVNSYNPVNGPGLDVGGYELYLQRYTPPAADLGPVLLGPALATSTAPAGGVTAFTGVVVTPAVGSALVVASAEVAPAPLSATRSGGTTPAVNTGVNTAGLTGTLAAAAGFVAAPVVHTVPPGLTAAGTGPFASAPLSGGADRTDPAAYRTTRSDALLSGGGNRANPVAEWATPSADPTVAPADDRVRPDATDPGPLPGPETAVVPPVTNPGTGATRVPAVERLTDAVFADLLLDAGTDSLPGGAVPVALALLGLGALRIPDLDPATADSRRPCRAPGLAQ